MSSACGLLCNYLGVGIHPSAIYLTCLGTPVCRVVSDRGKLCRMRPLKRCDQVVIGDWVRPEACSEKADDAANRLVAQENVFWSLDIKLQGVGNLTMIYRALLTVDEEWHRRLELSRLIERRD